MDATNRQDKKQTAGVKLLNTIFFFTTVLSLCAFSNADNFDKVKTIVFAGDSITDGAWGGGNGTKLPTAKRDQSDLNHIFGHSYMMLCASRLMADHPEQGLKFYNRGISANTLANLEERWDSDVLSLSPDMISILIGSNDVHFFLEADSEEEFDFKDWESRYRTLLDRALKTNPKVKFFIGTPFTAPTGKAGQSENYQERKALLKQMNRVITEIAKDYNATLLSYDDMFEGLYEKYPEVSASYWIWDGIHPTPAGHQAMADLWLQNYNREYK